MSPSLADMMLENGTQGVVPSRQGLYGRFLTDCFIVGSLSTNRLLTHELLPLDLSFSRDFELLWSLVTDLLE